ncbi:MAG: hypothetical protein KAT10_04050 [Sulfurimonas sp.]|nr:hypothetical protein [Sulfurimonas sp.]
MWLSKLKIAIVEKDTDVLDKLLDEVPKFTDVADAKEAMYLLREASILIHTLKDETSSSIKQIKKNIDFLSSTEAPKISKLDIKS